MRWRRQQLQPARPSLQRIRSLAAPCADARPAVRTFAATLAHPRRRSLAGPTPSVSSETPGLMQPPSPPAPCRAGRRGYSLRARSLEEQDDWRRPLIRAVCERSGRVADPGAGRSLRQRRGYSRGPARTRRASAMKQPATMHTGPLGSTFHILRADPETVTTLAAVDWNRYFRRVCLDPARGLITLMTPSFPHEDFTELLDDIGEIAGEKLAGTVRRLRSTRLRRRGDPPARGWSLTARSTSASVPGPFVPLSPKGWRPPTPSSNAPRPTW